MAATVNLFGANIWGRHAAFPAQSSYSYGAMANRANYDGSSAASVYPWVSGYVNPTPYRFSPERLRIVYTNDTHEKYRALPGMVTAFQQADAQAHQAGTDVLNFAAGDWNISTEANETELNVLLHNLMGIHASTLGNHELDPGSPSLANALAKANFTTVATNMDVPANSKLAERLKDGKLLRGARVIVGPSGQRYGVVGLTVPNAWKYMNPDAPMQGVATHDIGPSIAGIQRDVDLLHRAGVNRVILISHCGFEDDKKIAQNTSGIDIIVGGHSHTELKGIQPQHNFVTSKTGEPVMIVQTGKDAHALGVLDVAWDPWGRVVPLQNNLLNPMDFPAHPAALDLAERYLGHANPLAQVDEEISTEDAVSVRENKVADMVADAMRAAAGTDIALFRGTNLRSDVYKGELSDRDLKILLPFNDVMVTFQMTGAQIVEALNESARCIKLDEHHPGMLHPSGLSYVVDKDKGKVMAVSVYNAQTRQWEPLRMNRTYTVAGDEFSAKNPKEYPVFKRTPVTQKHAFRIRDAFGSYIQSFQGQPLPFKVDGRIQIVEGSARPWVQPSPPQNDSATRPWNASVAARGYTTLQTSKSKPYQPTLQALA